MNDKEVVEQLGQVIDTIDNYLTYPGNRFMMVEARLDAVAHGLTQIRDEVMSVYTELGGEDVWTRED